MWDERFGVEEFVYGEKPNGFLKNNVRQLKAPDVLCLAEGEGRNAVFLAQNKFNVFAVDSSVVAIKKAKKLSAKNKVSFQYDHCDIANYDFGIDRFDSIISIFAHTEKELREATFVKVRDSLKVGGVFLLEGYTKSQLEMNTGGPKKESMMFELDSIKDSFKNFEIVKAQEVTREIKEGNFHSGLSHTIQFIGIKK